MANKINYQVGFKVNQTGLKQLKISLQDLQNMKFSDLMKINNSDISSAREALRSIQQDAEKVESALNKAFNTKLNSVNIQTFNQELNQSGLNIEKVYESFSRAGATGEAAFRNLSTQLLSTNVQLRQSHAILDKMAETLANTVKWNIASTAVNSLTRSVEQAWGYVKSLDTSLNNISIVTGKSADEMAKFAVQANNAAKELGKTTTDYTNAALIYAQQGLNDQEIAERAAITLKAANVTGQSTDEVSEQLTAVWNGYKVTADEAELYVDRLAAVAAKTASDLEELSTGMSKVASAAAAMGVGEDQLAAQLSTIISVTKQAPESVGTALRTVYARISDIKAGIDEDGVTLGHYSGKMAELGFNVLDASGHLRDMGEVMEEIGGRWQDLTREQQISLAQTMAGQRQYNNLLALFDNFEQYNEALNIAQNAVGTLQEQQDTYMESTKAHLQVLKASVEDVYDSLIDANAKNGINDLIDGLSEAAGIVANLVESLGGGQGVLKTLGAIGFSVFSDQIAKSIQITIDNFRRASSQAQEFKKAISLAQEIQNKGLGGDYTQFLAGEQQSVLRMASQLPVDQFKAFQENFKQISGVAGDIDVVNAKIKNLTDNINTYGIATDQATNQWKSLDDMLNDPTGLEIIIRNLTELEKKFAPIIEKQKQFQEAYKNTISEISAGGSGAQAAFNKLQSSLSGFVNSLKTSHIADGNGGTASLFSFLSEDAQKSVSEAQAELHKLNFADIGNPQEAAQQITQVFSKINNTINNEIKRIKTAMEDATGGRLQELKKQLAKYEELLRGFEKTGESLTKDAQISIAYKNVTKLVSSVGQLGMVIQQVQNLDSIWKNQDLTQGQKTLQIVTNLSFTLPMLTVGIKDATTALTGLLGVSSMGATVGIGAVITAVTVGLTALTYFEKQAAQARKKIVQDNQATIDQLNAQQKELQTQQKLYDSLQELGKKYEEHTISRGQLKSSVEDLIVEYGLQGQAADKLRGNYDNLRQSLLELRKAQAQEKVDSIGRSVKAQQTAFDLAFQGTEGVTVNQQTGQTFYGKILKGQDLRSQQSQQLIQDLNKIQGINAKTIETDENGTLGRVSLSFNEEDMNSVDFVNHLTEVLNTYREELGNDVVALRQFEQTGIWKMLQKVIDNTSDSIEGLTDATKEFKEAVAQNIALNIQPIAEQSITSVQDYINARKELKANLKTELKANEIEFDDKSLNQMIDSELSKNSRDLFVQYDALADKITELQNKIHQALPKDVNELLSELNPNQLAFIEDLNVDYVAASWEEIRDIIEYISTADFSNLLVVTDPDAALENATSQYNLYSSLADQVSDSKNKTIGKKEFEKLSPEVQSFFTQMANGTYKMTGDAKEFYDTVNNLSLDGFKKNIKDLEASNQRLERLQNVNYNQVSQRATTAEDTPQLNLQLDYLTQSGYDINKIVQWQTHLADNTADPKILQEIADAIEYVGDKTKDFTTYLEANKDAIYQNELMIGRSAESLKDLKQLLDTGTIGEQAFTQAAIELDKAADIKNLDAEQLEEYSDHLQEISKQSGELSDELETNDDAAKIVAKSIMKMNNGVQQLSKNWDDWSEILKNSSETSEQYSEAMQQTQQAVADLLDISEDYVSEDFIKNHLDEIAAAAQGSEGAIDSLKSALAEDIVARIMLENGIDETAQTEILSELAILQATLPDIEVGATINDGDFLAKANQLIQDCGMTVDQANAVFDALGFEANFKTQQQTVTQRVPKTVTKTEVIGYNSGTSIDPAGQPVKWSYPTLAQWSYNDGYATETGTIDVPAMATNGKTPIINSLTRKPGGSFNNSSSKNQVPSSSGKNKGGGGKKGGGSGKAAKPDTSQKELKKALEDERDIYHDINIELQQINRNLDRAQKKQDRLYGKQLLDNLNEQSRILAEHRETLKEKQKLQEDDLKKQRQTLKNLGVTFDKYGNISNYMSLMGQKQAEINTLIAEENSLIKAYNEQTNADVKKAISDQIAAQQKKVKAAEDEYKNLQNKIKTYDETMENLQDTIDEIEEEAQRQIEINIQKFTMEVEIRLDMGQAERDWNKFRRQVLEHTDIIRDTDFHEIFGDATQNMRDLTSYFDVHGSIGSLQALTRQALATREQIDQINATGTSDIYGDNKAQAMEDLQGYLDELMDQMADVKKLIDEIDKAYLNTIDDIEEQFDKQIDDFEYIGELIEHDMDLLQLLYGDKNYDAMNNYYETLEQNNLKQLDALKQQRDFWKQQWDQAVAAGDTKAAQKFEQNYREAIQNLNQLIQDSAQAIQDKYVNAINKIFDELDKKITDGKGTDYLSMEWDLMNKNADEYLDTINSAFAVQETQRKYQQALNDTKNIKNQQALKSLMDEQLGILKNKEKLTQYDVDRAEKLLQVEQARIALQDAQSAKTSMRLKRDSQGNYSYEYVADEGAIGEAEANLAAAQNELYNFDLDRYKSNLNDMLAAWKDFQQDYKDILTDTSLSEEEKIERLALLREQYGEYINGKTEQNLAIRVNLTDSAISDLAALYGVDVENYKNMFKDEQDILMNDLIPAWDSGIQKLIDKVAEEGGFIPTTEDAFGKLHDATKEYEEQLDQMAETAGIDLNDVKNGVDTLAATFDVLTQANDDLIDRMGMELSAIGDLRTQAQGLVTDYENVYTAAAQAVTELHNFVQAEQGAAAAYAQTAAAYESMITRIQAANADYVRNPLGSGYTPPSGGGNDNPSGGTDNSPSGTDSSPSGTNNNPSGNQDPLKKRHRGNRGCFAAGTKIIMADQLVKNIEDIQVGDLVMAYNDEICTYEPRKVTKTFIHQNMPELVNIILSNGIVLKITPGHPILTTEGWKSLDVENSWYEHGVQVTLLKINDEILGYNGNTFVSGIYYLPFSNYTVYNLEVETCHTFLADGVVVHNVKVNDPIRLSTGGYTGDWSSDEGKIAILHKRQQVFNEDDTQKLLEATQILREITSNSDISLRTKMQSFNVKSVTSSGNMNTEELQQNVSISASFPNVNSKREIEEAFNDLVNLAAQRAMRRR